MFRELALKFRQMRPSLRSLVLLYWTNAFTGSMVGIFLQIYLYQKFTSVSLNLVANMVLYTGLMVGFIVPGVLASVFRLNIKQGFIWSFVVAAGSILSMLYVTDVTTAYLTMFFYGVGQGLFWLTVNTFELSETKDHERDFYSSVLSAGNQIWALLGPALATFLIWLSGSVFHLGTFTLLFSVAPVAYLLGLLAFKHLRDYRPSPMKRGDIAHFFMDRRNQWAQLYTLGQGFEHILSTVIPPLVILYILGTALRVGVYDTLFAVFSAFCILLVARYRTPSNRLWIYGASTIVVGLVTALLGYSFTFAVLIVYTFFEGFVGPIRNVSTHVLSLHSMEIGREESDFYPTMILRDFTLWIFRMLGGLALLLLLTYSTNEAQALSLGMYLLAASCLLTYVGGVLLMRASTRFAKS